MRTTTLVVGLALALLPSTAAGHTAAGTSDTHFQRAIAPILRTHCHACHAQATPRAKGNFRIDRLAPDFADRTSRDAWLAVLKRVEAGEMPPRAKPRPSAREVQTLLDWVRGEVKAAEARRAAEGRVALRRLNRNEYENTIRDLLGIDLELKELLPADGMAGGFDNVSDALHVSSFLMDKYLEAAEKALDVAIANGPQPALIRKRYLLKDTHQVKVASERVFRHLDDGTVVCFASSPWQAVTLSPFYPPDRGRYRFRISASAFQSNGKPVTYRVDAGRMGMAGNTHLVSYFDAPPDKPAVAEFVEALEPRSTIRILPYGLASAQAVHKIGAGEYTGPGLAVQWIEVDGPLHDHWPPGSHRRLFGDLPRRPLPAYADRRRVEVVSADPEKDAERILRAFGRRAFRRAVTDADIQPFLKLVRRRLAEKHTFEQAVRVGLMGMLVSPKFLFLRERAGQLDDFALASRLSYFLWSTMPDDELLALAEQNRLHEPAILRQQVERLLNSPKAQAFTENFVGQWLGLRELNATIPSHILYPEYDEMLNAAMPRETYLFFDELLRHDLSLTNFVASDFAMLNGRLARHYGIPGIDGWAFRKVTLPKGSHRGGVLTMASVLKVTANGTYTSPILRGAWVLDRVLGTPPPRPPEGVSAVEPDIRGATTIRKQLAKHRQDAACAGCHAKIDPPGFALENFDVIGGWRDYYRTSGNGRAVLVNGRRMPYLQGPPVDAADELPGGRKFRDIDELKTLLLADRDQLARALTVRLVTYATGAVPQPADQPEIEAIVRTVRAHQHGLRTLIHTLVASKLFQHK